MVLVRVSAWRLLLPNRALSAAEPHTAPLFPFQRDNLGAFPPLSHQHSPADLQNLNLFLKLFQIWLKLASDFRSYQGSSTLQLHVLNSLKNQTRLNTLPFWYCWGQAVALLPTSCNWLADLFWGGRCREHAGAWAPSCRTLKLPQQMHYLFSGNFPPGWSLLKGFAVHLERKLYPWFYISAFISRKGEIEEVQIQTQPFGQRTVLWSELGKDAVIHKSSSAPPLLFHKITRCERARESDGSSCPVLDVILTKEVKYK